MGTTHRSPSTPSRAASATTTGPTEPGSGRQAGPTVDPAHGSRVALDRAILNSCAMTRELASGLDFQRSPTRPLRSVTLVAMTVVGATLGCRRQPEPEPAPAPTVTVQPPAPTPPAPSRPASRATASITDSIFILTNRERVRADLSPLRRSPELTRAAQVHAEQMAASRKLAHDIPGAR